MRGRLDKDWATFHKKYIEFWQYKYAYLLTCEPFLTLKLQTSLDYIDWLRHHGKSYLLLTSEKSRQRHRKMARQGSIKLRSRGNAAEGSTSPSHAHEEPVVVQPPSQYDSCIPVTNPFYFTPSSQDTQSFLALTHTTPVYFTLLPHHSQSFHAPTYSSPLYFTQAPLHAQSLLAPTYSSTVYFTQAS